MSCDVFDTFFSPIRIDTFGLDIMRILPSQDFRINSEWISDKSRFNYEGYTKQRITFPFIFLYRNFFYVS